MFSTENATSGTVTVYLYDADCVVTELTDIVVTVLTISGKTYYIHEGDCFYPFLECGTYKLEIVDGTHSYFSVPFSAVCDMNDIPDGYRALRDFNGCVMRDETGVILYEECIDLPDVLFVDSSNPAKVYLYNVPLKTIILLDVPGVNRSSADIAHTNNKLWLYGTYVGEIREWDITLEPFLAVFNRNITGLYSSSGLCAIDNTTIIAIAELAPYPLIAKVNECDITANISVNTLKFNLIQERYTTGDYILTTTNKFIILTTTRITLEKHITQYDYLTGILEIDLQISPTMSYPYGLFEYNGEIYITDLRSAVLTYIWKISKYPPYNLTLYDSTNIPINGASQMFSQLTAHLST